MSEHSRVDLLDVIAFIRVLETGSISKAAERSRFARVRALANFLYDRINPDDLSRSTVYKLGKRQPSGCAFSNSVFSNAHLDQGRVGPA